MRADSALLSQASVSRIPNALPCSRSVSRRTPTQQIFQASRLRSRKAYTCQAESASEQASTPTNSATSSTPDSPQTDTEVPQSTAEQAPRDDDVLPDSLTDAILQASESTITAIEAGSSGVVAEVLLGEFWDPGSGAVFAEEGDQQRFWKLTRKFADSLVNLSESGTRVRALYPDMGVAAMLKNQWTDASFSIGSMSDRTPFDEDDDIIVFAAPDPQALDAAKKITAAARDAGLSVVMFNPRLASGEVGLGLNVRRMINEFLNSFTIAYSLRPIGDIGTVFRRFPGRWKVFLEDSALQGRYTLATERDERPAGEALDMIVQAALSGTAEGSDEPEGLGQQIGRTVSSVRRFMNALTK